MRSCQFGMKTFVFFCALFLSFSVFSANIVQADDYSRHCQSGESGDGVTLTEGTYKGTWEESLSITQVIKGHPLKQVFGGSGTFKLKIDRSTTGQTSLKDNSSIQGEMQTFTRMDTTMAAQRLAGKGELTLKDAVGTNTFTAQANHTTSGTIRSPNYVKKQEFSDVVVINFTAEKADCNGASGKVRSEALTQIAQMAESAGYQIEWLPAKWEMTRVEDASDEIAKLKEELKSIKPGGTNREGDSTRLGEIADRIKKGPKDLQDCLFKIWFEHAKLMYEAWVVEDTAKLNGYNGAYEGLMKLASQALAADRSLSLMGLDTCTEDIHRNFWEALQGAMARYLKRMVDGKAPMEHLLEVMRQGELLGAVSPELSQQCWEEIQKQAAKEADKAWEEYQKVYKAAPGKDADKAKNETVLAALKKAMKAEQAAQLCGVDINRALKEAEHLQEAANSEVK